MGAPRGRRGSAAGDGCMVSLGGRWCALTPWPVLMTSGADGPLTTTHQPHLGGLLVNMLSGLGERRVMGAMGRAGGDTSDLFVYLSSHNFSHFSEFPLRACSFAVLSVSWLWGWIVKERGFVAR